MVLFAPCVDDNTLAIIHVNLVLLLVLYLHMHTGMCNLKFHHIMNMNDQFMRMNTIQQPLLSCSPNFYALAIPMSCYISNVFYYLFVFFFFVCFGRKFFLFVSRMTANIYLQHRHSIISNLHSAVELS